MKKFVLAVVLGGSMCFTGCWFLDKEIKMLPDGTKIETFKGEEYLDAAKNVSEMAQNSGIPAVNLIGFGVTTLLGVATGILGKIAKSRSTQAKTNRELVKTTILGIEEAAMEFDNIKNGVVALVKGAGNEELAGEIDKKLSDHKIKENIKYISVVKDVYSILDRTVQEDVKLFKEKIA